jgi:hypothetical protein
MTPEAGAGSVRAHPVSARGLGSQRLSGKRGRNVPHQAVVTLTFIVAGDYVTGSLSKAPRGEHRFAQTRPIACRVADAPAEIAELIGWAVTAPEAPASLFD